MRDTFYRSYGYHLPEVAHGYGEQVHLLADPVLLTQLARLCQPETLQPESTALVRDLYQSLVRLVIANELPRRNAEVRTRMFTATPAGVWSGSVLDPTVKVVTVGMARAGTLPSQIAFETLTRLVNPDLVRQDHVYMERVTGAGGQVIGVEVAGSKIGGDVGNAIVLLPDPMGATGGSMVKAVSMYKELDGGAPRRLVAIHLIVTPEYLSNVLGAHPEMLIYAVRLDRGLSPPEVLKTRPGELWNQEKGLNERHYIVPGAGGLGEILNNAYV